MNVVLLILKIIGIILLCLAGLVLFLILMILVVPFRYSGTLRKEDRFEGHLRFSYLLHLIEMNVEIGKEGITPELRILYCIRKKIDLSGRREEPAEEEPQPEEPEKVPLKERFETLSSNLKKLGAMADNERVERAVSYALRKLRAVFRSVLPRKASGFLNVGLSDPCKTGKLLAFIAETIPIHRNQIAVEPDFEHQVFRADVTVKGRLWLIAVLILVAAVILNRDVLYTIKLYRKYFGKKKEEAIHG